MLDMTPSELFDYFHKNKICESLKRDDVEIMSQFLMEKTLKQNEVLSEMGVIGDSMYFIVEGKIVFTASDGQDESDIGVQGPGNLIGEMSFFDGVPRLLRMTAKSKHVKLLELSRPMYQRLRVEHPYIAVNLIENAVVSLDHLIRSLSSDISQLEHYMKGFGRH